MDPYNHSTPIYIKLPIFDTGKFKQWKFRIQQYLQHKHYALWEVTEFDDSYKAPPEETAKDKGLACEVFCINKEEGKNSILKTFGGNEATKKTKKNQLKQKYGNFKAKGSETLEQTFNRLQSIKIGKKIIIQGSDVDGFEKSKVECLNFHKIGHFARECKSSRSQDSRKSERAIRRILRPTPSIDVSKSISKELEERWKSNNPSFFEQGGSSGNVVPKPMIKFVKESGCPNATKVNNTKNAKKPNVKYA
nr:hypothetical protein [Tanacetum cinerariifolium]